MKAKKKTERRAAPAEGLPVQNPLLIEVWESCRGRFGRNQYSFDAFDDRDRSTPFSGTVWSESRLAADADIRAYVEDLVESGAVKAEWNDAVLSWLVGSPSGSWRE